MAYLRGLTLLLVVSGAARAANTVSEAESRKNPIRRVVDMLQQMQTRVTEEGKKEAELYEKFACWCKTGGSDLTGSITAAEAKIGQVTTAIEEAEALKEQLQSELAQHKADRAEAKEAVAQASAIREKEAAEFAKASSDLKTNIDALSKATGALEKGMTGSFLQTSAAATLRKLTIDMDMSNVDRDVISAFLSQGAGYVPQGGQITGILKEMSDTMEKDLSEITATETTAISDYEALVAAKEKEIAANSEAIESKLEREGQVSVEIVTLKEDLDDTGKALYADKKFLANMEDACKTKQAEWTERSMERANELSALAETIKVLNDDDALELFKKTLPSASLLQTTANTKDVVRKALAALQTGRGGSSSTARRTAPGDSRMQLIALALRGGSKSFEKVIKMIDDMVSLLGKEQTADDEKKAYCEKELDKSEDELKILEQKVDDLEKAIEDATGMVATLTEEIEALEDGIKKLDKEVTEATETRKAEHANYVDTMSADNAAKDLIGVAKNRLAKFYAPKLYKPPPKRELTAEERITVSMGGSLETTAPPGGIAGTGISYLQEHAAVLAQVSSHTVKNVDEVAPPPPPETWDAYQKKGEEHAGVISLLDMLVADLDKEIQSMTVDEKDAQAEYETMMEDSAAKRTADSQSIAEKEGAKADLEGELEKMTGEKKDTKMAVIAKAEYIKDLHLECDWLVANFEMRKTARAGEVESLKNAKAVLSGADYSLLQTNLRGASRP